MSESFASSVFCLVRWGVVGVADTLGGAALGQRSRLRDELLSGEVFAALTEAKLFTEDWRID